MGRLDYFKKMGHHYTTTVFSRGTTKDAYRCSCRPVLSQMNMVCHCQSVFFLFLVISGPAHSSNVCQFLVIAIISLRYYCSKRQSSRMRSFVFLESEQGPAYSATAL
ncbi:hypothetical protein B0O99DRAFT_9359 [Bisporella sp. PMI_857]|nr:hypothetical protein B0O99DRAFT_9359 [Bisporella sp. PMI_857]